MKNRLLRVALLLGTGAGLAAAGGCGDRNERWDLSPTSTRQATMTFGLTDAVAVVDPAADRVLLLTSDRSQNLSFTSVPVQRAVRTAVLAPDRSKLFILSAGDGDARPPLGKAEEKPALQIVTRDPAGRRVYPLSDPLAGLALDPKGQWAVVYPDDKSTALVRNPNELLLVDLTMPAVPGVNPLPHALRSFGGRPQRFTFTDVLHLPGGPRRLLIVETELDVAVLDLGNPAAPEITIQLTSGQDARQLSPAGISISDGDPAADDDARIAIRLANDPTVILAQLVPDSARDFRPDLNLTDVGGVPSDAAFVRTDGGALNLAVLVPSRSRAVLIDPTTSITLEVPLPAAYSRLSLVTDSSGKSPGDATGGPVDVALLWNATGGAGGGVAFWELGRTAGQPYRSVESVGVTAAVSTVLDVSGIHPELKILGTNAASFFLLNLKTRTSSPFLTAGANLRLTPSGLGDRAWAHVNGTRQLSVIDLVQLHAETIPVDRAISALFEIATVDGEGAASRLDEARSLVVWQDAGNLGATVYDAGAVISGGNIDQRRNYSSILTEGL